MRDALDHFFSDQRKRFGLTLTRIHQRYQARKTELGPLEVEDRGSPQPYRKDSRDQQRQRSMRA